MKIVKESGSLAFVAVLFFSCPQFHAAPPSPPPPAPPGEAKAAPRPPGPKKDAGSKGEARKTAGDAKADGSGKEAPEGRGLAEIEKDLKRAHAAKDFARLGALAEEALETKDPAACRPVIQYCLQGEDRDLEMRVFNRLIVEDDPAARAVIYGETTKSANFKTRIILLGVVKELFKKDPAAFASLAAGLRDRNRVAALTAVRWIKEAKDPGRSVPALIEALRSAEKNPLGRFYFDVKSALKSLTGVDLDFSGDWKNYWDSVKAGRAPKPRQGPTKSARSTGFFSVPLESDQVLFIIDISGSMEKRDPPMPEAAGEGESKKPQAGKTVVQKTKAQEAEKKKAGSEDGALPQDRQRIWRVKKELVRIVKELPDNVRFTVMSFNHEIHYVGDTPRLLLATPDNKLKVEGWVKAMVPNGETWSDTAFESAFMDLPEVDTIYFLSDGAPYRNGTKIPDDKVLNEVKEANRFVKCRIHTFGFFQEGVNLRRFLEKLALQNDGKFTALR